MFPKFLEDSYKIVLRKHFMEHPRVSFIEDDNSMFLNNIVHLKSHMAIKKNQYMDFFQHPEYYTFLEQLQSGKIAEILNKCSHPEKRSLMPYLIKYLRYSEFLKKAEILLLPSQNDSKTSLKQTKITINSEKLNQDNQLFSKLSKSRIINLDNVGNGVVLAYLEYMSKIENGKIDSLMIPNSFDLNHFNNIYQNQDPDELKSPEIKSTLKMLPKVLTISSNLETNTKAASFVILNKKNSFPDIESRENQSLHEKKNISSTHSSAFINQNENVNILSPMISIKNINSNNDINQESNKFKLKIFNTDFGYKGHSPSSPSNKLLNKIQNFGIYYHTVKRNVNPENNHKRQYSKSIQ